MLNDGADVEELEPLAEELATDKDEGKAAQHVLWVEKYTPKYFTELLSDDVSTNDYVMYWYMYWETLQFYSSLFSYYQKNMILIISHVYRYDFSNKPFVVVSHVINFV